MLQVYILIIFLFSTTSISSSTKIYADDIKNGQVLVGADRLFSTSFRYLIEKKRVGLITNQTGITRSFERTSDLFIKEHERGTIRLIALFAPEHGIFGEMIAGEKVPETKYQGIPVYSLHGLTRRPTKEMLSNIEVLVFDIQDIGTRSYTFASTLYYCLEEAAKWNIKVIVLDRPNPLGGRMVDGPMLEESCKSFIGYINVPYCHGMTIGELARFFNTEQKVFANLTIVPMVGWKRWMRFEDTELPWIPTSPYVPEPTTPLFYPTTGLIGELGFVSIGIGYTLPFKVIAAPFIKAKEFVRELNKTSIKGIRFQEIWIKPFSGLFSGKTCQGALLISDSATPFPPVSLSYWVFDVMKRLYPKELQAALTQDKKNNTHLEMFYKACGTKKVLDIIRKEKRPFSALCSLDAEQRKKFMERRKLYLFSNYGE